MPTQEEIRAFVQTVREAAIRAQSEIGPPEDRTTTSPHDLHAVGGRLVEEVLDPPADSPIAREWQTFKRELKRLLGNGEKGRFALIKGDELISTWDTLRDAAQAGREKFGYDTFLVQEIFPYLRPLNSGYRHL